MLLMAWIFSAVVSAGAEDLVWENSYASLVLTANGEFQAVKDRKTGQEYRPSIAAPFVSVVQDGTKVPATSAVKNGDRVDFAFGQSGVTAQLRITTHPLYFQVEITNLTGTAPDSVEFGNVPAEIKGNSGPLVNAVWNDDFAVCVMGLSPNIEGRSLSATVHRKFGLNPAKTAILALPPARFYEAVQRVEKDHDLPFPTLGGQWAKTSEDVRRGYLFIDLTEHNVDEVIRWARLGEFKYVLIFAPTWATTRGSYPINLKNFPSGEAGLKAVADKCHAAGLKVGIHCLTSFVAKGDALVRPKPDSRLLKDYVTALAADISEDDVTIPATSSVAAWPALPSISFAPNRGLDIQIDDEIIGYTLAGGPDGQTFMQCRRGLNGTRPAPHRKGAKVEHLAERYGHYFSDLRTSLNGEMAERIAGIVNRCGLDMLYFDGAASNSIMGAESWYWVTAAQQAVWQRLKREVLVEGAGRTHWTWHFYARGVCSDRVSLSPKTYLDYFKLNMWQDYRANFLPAHLGWWGVVDHQPDHPATTPDEVELHGVRMLALDSPIALETHLEDLRNNARSEQMLRLLGRYEQVRLARQVPAAMRERLRTGEWRMETRDGKPVFVPVLHHEFRFDQAGAVALEHRGAAQPLAFRLRAQPRLATPGDAANHVLFRATTPPLLETPPSSAFIAGGLAHRVEFAKATGRQPDPELVGSNLKKGPAKSANSAVPDLTRRRALAVRLEVEGPALLEGEPCPVLNVQLEASNHMLRDHHIDLDFRGGKTVILPGPTPDRTLPELWPAREAYFYRHAMMAFDYTRVTALNFRWMRTARKQTAPGKDAVRVRVHFVEALRESDAVLRNPTLSIGGATMRLPIEIPTDGYAEFSGAGEVRVFDANGRSLTESVTPTGTIPVVQPGVHSLELRSDEFSPVKLTVITTAQP